jgi:hypothetical protein
VKPLKTLVWLLILAAIAFALWHYLFPPPERVIEKKLKALAETVSQNPEGNISRLANVNRIGSFFHPNVTISLEGFGREAASIQGRGELEQNAMGIRQNNFRIKVNFPKAHIAVSPERTNATALVTAEVTLNDQKEPIVQDIRLEFEKFDRTWLIRSATPAKALKIE